MTGEEPGGQPDPDEQRERWRRNRDDTERRYREHLNEQGRQWHDDPHLAQRVADGWVPFGFHMGYPGITRLEWDGTGEDGLPIWERLPRDVDSP